MIDLCAEQISEHTDCVQILCSWTDGGNTKYVMKGRGNWYARVGMAHAFVNNDAASSIAAAMDEEEGDGK